MKWGEVLRDTFPHLMHPAPCTSYLILLLKWELSYGVLFILSLRSIVPFLITCYVGTGKKILGKGEYNPAGDRLVIDLGGEGKAGATELACFGFGSFRCAWGLYLWVTTKRNLTCLFTNFQSIKEEKANAKSVMTNCQFTLNELFRKAITATFPDLPDAPVVVQPSQGDRFGDYQCNSAMVINQVHQVWSYQSIKMLFKFSNTRGHGISSYLFGIVFFS